MKKKVVDEQGRDDSAIPCAINNFFVSFVNCVDPDSKMSCFGQRILVEWGLEFGKYMIWVIAFKEHSSCNQQSICIILIEHDYIQKKMEID